MYARANGSLFNSSEEDPHDHLHNPISLELIPESFGVNVRDDNGDEMPTPTLFV